MFLLRWSRSIGAHFFRLYVDFILAKFLKLTRRIFSATSVQSPMPLYSGFIQLGAGLSVGLAGLSAGFAIGIVGDAGVRGTAQQSVLINF